MMKIQLSDKKNNPVTDWLIEINDKRLICDCDGLDLLPIGSIIDCDIFNIFEDNEMLGCYFVNKKDLKNYKIEKDYIGCCGPCGDMLNIRDNNDKPIGYEYGDCYQSHFIKILKKNVNVKKENINEFYTVFAITEYKNAQKIVDRAVGENYELIIKRLVKQIDKRLKYEFGDDKIIKELKSKIAFFNLKEIAYKFNKNKSYEKLWLYTKYEPSSHKT